MLISVSEGAKTPNKNRPDALAKGPVYRDEGRSKALRTLINDLLEPGRDAPLYLPLAVVQRMPLRPPQDGDARVRGVSWLIAPAALARPDLGGALARRRRWRACVRVSAPAP